MLKHPECELVFERLDDGRRRLRVVPLREQYYVHRRSWVTAYDDSTIAAILDAKGPAYLCDELARDEDPHYIRPHLTATITCHVDPQTLAGKRMLDFGCGAGASTLALSQLLPETQFVGIELDHKNLTAARARMEFYGLDNVTLLQSPSGDTLPSDLGDDFDAIMLPAVYEHLLPAERKTLVPMIWDLLRPGGFLFIDETPWRWFPIETHTTGLPFINYLPDALALRYARSAAGRIPKDVSWTRLLRDGVRGATVEEILHQLGPGAKLLAPCREGVDNYVDLWARGYTTAPAGRGAGLKRLVVPLLRTLHRMTGQSWVPYLSLAIQKAN